MSSIAGTGSVVASRLLSTHLSPLTPITTMAAKAAATVAATPSPSSPSQSQSQAVAAMITSASLPTSVTRSLYRATIRAARSYDNVTWQRVSLLTEPAIRRWLPSSSSINWSMRDDTCVELVRRAFRTKLSKKLIGTSQNNGFAALRALTRHQITHNDTTFQGALIRLLESETADMEVAETDVAGSENEHNNNNTNNNGALSIIGTVAHSRPRSSTYPLDDASVRAPRPYHGVPARAVPHDSLPPFNASTATPTTTTSSSTTTQANGNAGTEEVDKEQVREWHRIKTMVLSQLLEQSNQVTKLSSAATHNCQTALSRQFSAAGVVSSTVDVTDNEDGGGRGGRELSRGAHMFSWHRPLRRVSYDALLNVSIQERNVPLALSVLDVMSASQYRLSTSIQIALAEMFARSSHVAGALHVLRLSVWGAHARSLPSVTSHEVNVNADITATPRDVDPNDPVWLRVLNPVIFAVAQDASNNALAFDLFDMCHKYGITPNRGTYEALLLSCYFAKKPSEATRVLESMKNAGLAPSLSCYNAVLHTCSFDGSARESLRLVSQMKADNVQPNMDTYFWTYQSALKANDTQSMQMVLMYAKEQGIDPDAVSTGIKA